VTIGSVQADTGPRAVAFLPRHGHRHEFPPHRVNRMPPKVARRMRSVDESALQDTADSTRPHLAHSSSGIANGCPVALLPY
jgi:hypothetical protein